MAKKKSQILLRKRLVRSHYSSGTLLSIIQLVCIPDSSLTKDFIEDILSSALGTQNMKGKGGGTYSRVVGAKWTVPAIR